MRESKTFVAILKSFVLTLRCVRPSIPRDQNSKADHFSKVVDIDDYSVHDDVFIHLDGLWGPHSILGRFASSYNAKLPRFNSRFLQPSTEALDAVTA